jgi:hypothetical protein
MKRCAIVILTTLCALHRSQSFVEKAESNHSNHMSQAVEDIMQRYLRGPTVSDALEARSKTTMQRCAAKIPASHSLLDKTAHVAQSRGREVRCEAKMKRQRPRIEQVSPKDPE